MSAPIAEAHLRLANQLVASPPSPLVMATLIADSEARAVASAVTALTCTHHNDQQRAACPVCLVAALAAERDRLRAEVERLTAACDKFSNSEIVQGDWKARAERAEAELANIRALANRRNKQNHSHDTTHQLVASLDQALDIAQAELAAERARLDWLMAGGVVLIPNGSGFYSSSLYYPVSRDGIDAAMKEGAK